MDGDSAGHSHFCVDGFRFPVALEHDDATSISVAADYILAGIPAFVACRHSFWRQLGTS